MSAQHTQGRLVALPAGREYSLKVDGEYIGGLLIGGKESAAMAYRLVACWNLLVPFTTEQIEAFECDVLELAAQRDALLAALQKLAQHAGPHVTPDTLLAEAFEEAIAAIKSAGGQP